jgi:hypothetical protein
VLETLTFLSVFTNRLSLPLVYLLTSPTYTASLASKYESGPAANTYKHRWGGTPQNKNPLKAFLTSRSTSSTASLKIQPWTISTALLIFYHRSVKLPRSTRCCWVISRRNANGTVGDLRDKPSIQRKHYHDDKNNSNLLTCPKLQVRITKFPKLFQYFIYSFWFIFEFQQACQHWNIASHFKMRWENERAQFQDSITLETDRDRRDLTQAPVVVRT